ncbi:MAG: D-alanyl-D-alanine carboxypeptidase/D-alanyl-D-alanine-endopeptidase [Rhodobacteraceae bacterium HLUCCA08]|nr:MAG: D-alanyl-D-alanine carboxypeptidase/D-alanyl-D-alanine-endopeptidase [Rhodobacteraceae bacterium HLUCCA08]
MGDRLTRRAVLAGLLGSAGGVALAEAPLLSPRPQARTTAAAAPALQRPDAPPLRPDSAAMIAEAALGGTVAFVIADARSGVVLDAVEGGVKLPPASVTKAVTALYALEALGGAYRFRTRVLATGPVLGGMVQGDLVLAGGGDPVLSTDDLAGLAADLRAAGITGITGAFRVWGGALPYAEEIEPGQQDHLGYNPSVSGLNLNFNRVHFEWRRAGGDYALTMDARTETYRPAVGMARVRVVTRDVPVFTYEGGGDIDSWTVARSALGEAGSRWLPVRRPALYAGDVFRTLAAAEGLRLPAATELAVRPEGTELAHHDSDTLRAILQGMMLYSTNLTAEICGLAATEARGIAAADIAGSARAMQDWLLARHGIIADFHDHSGLSDANRIGAGSLVRLMIEVGDDGPLRPLMRQIALRDDAGAPIDTGIEIRAKTGTLNYVATLAGYVRTVSGRDLAFAFLASDMPRRIAANAAGDEAPAGAISYNSRAKALQQRLLQRWGAMG